jgi:glycosyltransferase involved in cell wall biosynthesis
MEMVKPLARKEVVIVQITCPHYRAPFFCGLRDSLQKQGINLRLLYGDSEKYKAFIPAYHANLAWAEPFEPLFLPLNSATLEPVTWHPILKRVLGADLIVTEAASRYLVNYLFYIIRQFGGPRLAFWGHGWNHFLDNQDSWSERIKLWMGKRADWYFAYTGEVKEGLVERGYVPTRITDVQNAVESPPPRKISAPEKAAIREDWNIGPDDPVALYCGRMYLSKRLEFLISAAEQVRRDVPSFQLVLVGGGPDEPIVREAAREKSYIHFAGPSFGRRKHELFAISRLFVLPGRVGLGVVDAFHHSVPPVATRYPYHSPEFSYLRHGENGLVSEDDSTSFAQAMVRLATDDALHARLLSGCKKSAQAITMEQMIERFANGIISALDMKPTIERNGTV